MYCTIKQKRKQSLCPNWYPICHNWYFSQKKASVHTCGQMLLQIYNQDTATYSDSALIRSFFFDRLMRSRSLPTDTISSSTAVT